jgi:hypothetical protein
MPQSDDTKEIQLDSGRQDAQSQLDSLFTQLREKARGAGWSVIATKRPDGGVSLTMEVAGPAAKTAAG